MRFLVIVIAIALCACRGSVPPAADAALRVALAEGGVRHAADAGCYTGCANGWTCDHFTGFCCNPAESSCHSTDPCEGRCAAYERCAVEAGLPHCESLPPDAGIAAR